MSVKILSQCNHLIGIRSGFKGKKVEGKEFRQNSKIKMSWEFQIKSCKKGGKIHLKMHITEPKSCNILPQLQKNTKIASKVGGGVCKKVPMLQLFII